MDEKDEEAPADEGLPGILGSVEGTRSGDPDRAPDSARASGPGSDEEAFALVGNEHRMEIIRTLGDFEAEEDATAALSFSALRDRADLDVGSSQFNYHLKQLLGRYVEKTGSGYSVRPEGKTLYRTVRAGTFTDRVTMDAVDLDQACYHCDGSLEAAYSDGMFTIQCRGCETLYDLVVAPPATVDDDEDLLARLTQYNNHLRVAFARGVCPTCLGGLDSAFVRPSETGFADAVERKIYAYRSCEHCGNHSYLSVGSAMLHHPAVISFCYERGLDVTTTPRWELAFAATDDTVSVDSTDPWRVALEVPVDDDTLEVVLNEDLDVVDSTTT